MSALQGKKIVITRAEEQGQRFAELIKERKGVPISKPLIKISPPQSFHALDQVLDLIHEYDGIFFTSMNGVRFFFERLKLVDDGQERLFSQVASKQIMAVGPKTRQELRERGVEVLPLPSAYKQEEFAQSISSYFGREARLLYPRAARVRAHLFKELHRQGINVDDVIVYQTSFVQEGKEAFLLQLANREWDAITFTSSSTVHSFMELLLGQPWREWLETVIIACLGPVTAQTAIEAGMNVQVSPQVYTLEELVNELEDHFAKRGAGNE